jgi:hypothetical protein
MPSGNPKIEEEKFIYRIAPNVRDSEMSYLKAKSVLISSTKNAEQ